MIFRIFQVSFLLLINLRLAFMESLKLEFPPVKDASEFASLSNAIYDTNSYSDTDVLPDDVSCYWYDEKSDGTQHMILM